jgi:hypothetical protein
MGSSESKYREAFLEPYIKDFKISEITDQVLQYRTRFLHDLVLGKDKKYSDDPQMMLAIAKYYVMLNLFADFDLDSRKEELEKVPRLILDESFVQFLTMHVWSAQVNWVPGHKPLVDIIGSMQTVTYD